MLVRLCAGQLNDGLGGTARDSGEYVGMIIFAMSAVAKLSEAHAT
jgi:hypothetical protein